MKAAATADFREAIGELEKNGLLLASDSKLPSVSRIVAGEPIKGSWWGHPRSHEIHAVTEILSNHPDVVVTKLVSGKVTYLHRRLWPPLFAVAVAMEPWQLDGLSNTSRFLLDLVSSKGQVRTDSVELPESLNVSLLGNGVRDLEKKILVHSEEVHTETGAHAKLLQSWGLWASRVRLSVKDMPTEVAKREIGEALQVLNSRFGARGKLPWESPGRRHTAPERAGRHGSFYARSEDG
jgi:hypothetical protein